MRIWLEDKSGNLGILKAAAGGIKGGIYLDGTELSTEALGITTCLVDQGFHPVVLVKFALAMKKLYEGIAIIIGDTGLKSKPDAKTLIITLNGNKNETDKAIEQILAFFKIHKIPSSI
jgi:hypothetical protein